MKEANSSRQSKQRRVFQLSDELSDLLLVILKAILGVVFFALVLTGYVAYYSYKGLRYALRYINSKIRERRSNASSRLRYNKDTNRLEEY